MSQLPYEILEAMIQCFGRCFHFKDRMAAFLANCEVPKTLIDKYRQEHKFVWARKLLTEQRESEHNQFLQRKILTALCQLRNLPDSKVEDRDAGLLALIKPTHKLYGQILLFIDRPQDAQRQFERALLWHPNRARSLLGLARAAIRIGNIHAARHSYDTLLNIWNQADPDLPELHEAQQYLQQTAQQ
jgi:tetratricopeptide (TPR) repeat protein